MAKKNNKFVFMFLGMIVGATLTLGLGLGAYKVYRESKRPKRYIVTPDINKRYLLPDGSHLYVASSLDRIFKDGNTLVRPTTGKEATLSLACNEYEAFQVVVQAGQQPVKSASLEFSDLVKDNSPATISKKYIFWRVVGYVPTIEPYYPVKYVGNWPDPLLPPAAMEVNAGTTQPFWVTVYVPKDTAPGFYKGSITYAADGVSQEIPIQVRVYDFTIPVEGSLKTAFDFYGHQTFKRYPREDKESDIAYQARLASINDQFQMAMLEYRLNPILNVDPRNNAELAAVDKYRVYGLNNFSIGKRGGTFGNNWPDGSGQIEHLSGEYQTYGEMLKLNRFLPYTYIYTWDEGNIGNPKVAKICSMIHRSYPGLKNMVCYHGFWDPDTNPEWGKDIDIWTFQIDSFNEALLKKLQRVGKEIWMYVSGPSGQTSPNLIIDGDSIDYRIIPWLCWKYDIKGFLYWCVNWWPLVDPFKNAKNSDWEQNGNGLLFYPGADGPMASLRLEIFRDGLEDYEYTQIFLKKLQALKKTPMDEAAQRFLNEGIRLLTVDDSIAASVYNFTKNGEVLVDRRNAIAEKIEEFNRRFGSIESSK